MVLNFTFLPGQLMLLDHRLRPLCPPDGGVLGLRRDRQVMNKQCDALLVPLRRQVTQVRLAHARKFTSKLTSVQIARDLDVITSTVTSRQIALNSRPLECAQ